MTPARADTGDDEAAVTTGSAWDAGKPAEGNARADDTRKPIGNHYFHSQP
jgi:hypothetical protein